MKRQNITKYCRPRPKKARPRFGEFCSCCCLPLLPGFACRIHATWGPNLLAKPCVSHVLTGLDEGVVVACEDEPSRRLGVEGGDDVVEGDALAQHRVLLVRHRLHAPAHPPHLLRYVLQKQGRYVAKSIALFTFILNARDGHRKCTNSNCCGDRAWACSPRVMGMAISINREGNLSSALIQLLNSVG